MREPGALRVAFVAGTLARGGAEIQAVRMAEALVGRGVDVRVVALRGGALEARLTAAGVPVRIVGRHEAPPVRLLAIIRALHSFRPHVVQATHFFANLYAAGAGAALGAISIGAIRNTLAYELGANRGWGRLLLRAPVALVANSDAARRDTVAAGLAPSRVHFVPNALAPPDVRPAGEVADVAIGPGPLAITVARLAPAKRVDLVLDALAIARTRAADLRLLVVGDGPERAALEARARDLGLTDGVRFLGERDDIPALLARADVFVLASDHEGTPNAMLEAMQAGLPVVTTSTADAARLVEVSAAGIVVERGDAEALAGALVHLAETPQARAAMGGAGLRVAAAHHADSLGARLLEVYRRCAEQRRDDRVRSLCAET